MPWWLLSLHTITFQAVFNAVMTKATRTKPFVSTFPVVLGSLLGYRLSLEQAHHIFASSGGTRHQASHNDASIHVAEPRLDNNTEAWIHHLQQSYGIRLERDIMSIDNRTIL